MSKKIYGNNELNIFERLVNDLTFGFSGMFLNLPLNTWRYLLRLQILNVCNIIQK